MNHSNLEKIYNDIREEPYLVSTEANVKAPNCYFKGMELIETYARLGVPVRAKVAIFDWKKSPIPSHITDLISNDITHTHFYVEALIDNDWRTLDPSIDPKSEKLGFRMVDFKGDENSCFELSHVFSDHDQAERYLNITDQEKIIYFQKMKPFLKAFNEWIEAERAKL